ncbi:MAG: hypothetical protein FJW96_10630, partial [Actinobacteria bacterium]|nr:hypothetical protein [Actinomycetota bacterium]
MSMPKGQKFEHAHLVVEDLEGTLAYYTDVIGLVELAREDGVVYLGCGLDTNYDFALSQGPCSVDHFAIRAEDGDEVDRYARRLADAGVTVEPTDGSEPGQVRGIRFQVPPNGQRMELVTVEDNRYLNAGMHAVPGRGRGISPLDTCHINLVSMNMRESVEFLTGVLDFRLSEYADPERDGNWLTAFTRKGSWHHDVGFMRGDASIHHVAVAMASFEHIKTACDLIAASGERIELGPSRHPVAANLYVYAKLPGGHRFEFSAEMALLEPATPTVVWEGF